MPIDPQVQTILDGLASADAPPLTEQSVEQVRASMTLMGQLGTDDPVGEVEDSTVPGPAGPIPVRIYRPAPAPTGTGLAGGLVYYHGGGFVIGDLDTHDSICRSLCSRAGIVVVSVDYRLAPEDPFPAAPDDAVAAFDAIHERAGDLGIDPGRLATGGDSAGANLAAVVANQRRGTVAFQLLIYPVTDLTRSSVSYRENSSGYLLTAELMEWFETRYTQGTVDVRDPRASPLFTDDLAGVAPALVVTAEFDPLRDEGEAYGARLLDAGVDVSIQRYDGLIHGFIQMGAVIESADAAIDDLAAALRDALA